MRAYAGRMGDLGENIRKLGEARAAPLVALVVLVVFALLVVAGGPAKIAWVYETFGLSRAGFLSGEIWQPMTYGLLHGPWWHVGLNAAFVLLVGARVESILGAKMMVRTVMAGIISGGLFHLVLGTGLLVGLSGGCMALLLVLTSLSPQSRMFPLPVSAKNLGFGILLAEAILTMLNPSLGLPGFSALGRWVAAHGCDGLFELGYACHLGGGIAGLLIGRWVLRSRVSLKQLQDARARRERRLGLR